MKASKFFVIASGVLLTSAILFSCSSIPSGAKAVTDFELKRYMGKWYEIARLDFKYEKNLDSTTAMYSINDDGSVKVVNRGYNYVTNENQEAIGKAKFRTSDSSIGELKVSFFGPFYAAYNVVAIDSDYQYALVAGGTTKYLWILSRTKTVPEEVKQEYLAIAQSIGYNTDELVWVNQDR